MLKSCFLFFVSKTERRENTVQKSCLSVVLRDKKGARQWQEGMVKLEKEISPKSFLEVYIGGAGEKNHGQTKHLTYGVAQEHYFPLCAQTDDMFYGFVYWEAGGCPTSFGFSLKISKSNPLNLSCTQQASCGVQMLIVTSKTARAGKL